MVPGGGGASGRSANSLFDNGFDPCQRRGIGGRTWYAVCLTGGRKTLRDNGCTEPPRYGNMAEEATASPEEVAAPQRPSKVLTIVVGAVALLVGGGLGTGLVGPRVVKRLQAAAAAHASDSAKADAGSTVMHQIDNLVLNPAGTGGTRFLMVTVAIEVRDAAVNQQMNDRDAEVRDQALQLLGSKTVDQLADVGQRVALRRELKDRLSKLFAPGAIRQIYFPQFVIQ